MSFPSSRVDLFDSADRNLEAAFEGGRSKADLMSQQ
jgi:hypothetical protein